MTHYCALTKRPLKTGDELVSFVVLGVDGLNDIRSYPIPTIYQKDKINVPRGTFESGHNKHTLEEFGSVLPEHITNSLNTPRIGDFSIVHILRNRYDELIEYMRPLYPQLLTIDEDSNPSSHLKVLDLNDWLSYRLFKDCVLFEYFLDIMGIELINTQSKNPEYDSMRDKWATLMLRN